MKHSNPADKCGAQVELELENNEFDFVILQEQSHSPITSPDAFYTGSRSLVKKVRANGATPVFYSTWGRKTGSSILTDNGLTNESMTYKLAAAYTAIGEELGVECAYVGLAFYDVYTNDTSVTDLYASDLSHPSYSGSYLAAMTLFAEIFNADPTTVKYNGTLSDSVASVLKAAAQRAAAGELTVPDEYKTSSEGIECGLSSSAVDYSKMNNLKSFPSSSVISVLKGGTYPNGKNFSGILGTKGQVASEQYSTTSLTEAQKADIADIGYGVSVIGAEKMNEASKGYTTAVENLVNGHWGVSLMSNIYFDDNKYDIEGKMDPNGKYTALITLNFGTKCRFDSIGFFSGNLQGFPGAAEVYVSDDAKNWTVISSACWDAVNGKALTNIGKTGPDPYNNNTAPAACLFGMEGFVGQYVRIGIVIGRSDSPKNYNTINTREFCGVRRAYRK